MPGAASPNLAAGGEAQSTGQPSEVYRTLLGQIAAREPERYVRPGSAKASPLIWLLLGRRLEVEHTPYTGVVTQMPPGDTLTPRERILITEWVDLGALWDAGVSVSAEREH